MSETDGGVRQRLVDVIHERRFYTWDGENAMAVAAAKRFARPNSGEIADAILAVFAINPKPPRYLAEQCDDHTWRVRDGENSKRVADVLFYTTAIPDQAEERARQMAYRLNGKAEAR